MIDGLRKWASGQTINHPDPDVDQLSGDVSGGQLPHLEERSRHLQAHHLHLPLPALPGAFKKTMTKKKTKTNTLLVSRWVVALY